MTDPDPTKDAPSADDTEPTDTGAEERELAAEEVAAKLGDVA